MPRSCYQIIGQFMACDKFCAVFNEICNLIGIGINFNFSCALLSLVGAVMSW